MSETLLKVENVSKKFCRHLKRSYLYGLYDMAGFSSQKAGELRPGEFWALENISFEIKRGESVGLIGRNGSGKTTLLKLIADLILPTKGEIATIERIAPLIALGAGFNPILSGRENVYINLSILGLSVKQIENVFDQILDFSELQDAIDAPLFTYSSGMRARLGFACAIHTNAELLLIDEVLAVGDVQFRTKCYKKLSELQKNGTTFIIVSHNPMSIISMCDRGILIEKGKVLADSNAIDVMREYEKVNLKDQTGEIGRMETFEKAANPYTDASIVEVKSLNKDLTEIPNIRSGEEVFFEFTVLAKKVVKEVHINILISDLGESKEKVLYLRSSDYRSFYSLEKGINKIKVKMDPCLLRAGGYSMKVSLIKGDKHEVMDMVESFVINVDSEKSFVQCQYLQPMVW